MKRRQSIEESGRVRLHESTFDLTLDAEVANSFVVAQSGQKRLDEAAHVREAERE